jgi:hypothetical protein
MMSRVWRRSQDAGSRVVGGALVYRDADHITRVFGATPGPICFRKSAD